MPKLKLIELVEKVTEKEVSVNEYIANRIKYYRKKNNMTQEDLAAAIGLSRPSVMNIESNRHSTTFEVMYLICKKLNCKIQDIFPNP